MALPALVLVHGGGLAADSWELTVAEIHRLAPELTVLTVDLPGRRYKPGDLREMTIADFVDSLAVRVREMIFAAAFLPPEGTSLVERDSHT
ncbi:MAG TPA: alpha/beta fold hydrolase [Mycobacterium sp.]